MENGVPPTGRPSASTATWYSPGASVRNSTTCSRSPTSCTSSTGSVRLERQHIWQEEEDASKIRIAHLQLQSGHRPWTAQVQLESTTDRSARRCRIAVAGRRRRRSRYNGKAHQLHANHHRFSVMIDCAFSFLRSHLAEHCLRRHIAHSVRRRRFHCTAPSHYFKRMNDIR
jgi:hypothetical protein